MRDIFIKCSLLFLFTSSHILGYGQDRFVFSKLDQTIIEFWIDSDKTIEDLSNLIPVLKTDWERVKKQIITSNYTEFDKFEFIENQENRVLVIQYLLGNGKVMRAKNEAFIFLKEFQDIRGCFTKDDYDLDAIIVAYDAYESVHEIIHDQMMGLYEWNEFIWFLEKLKCKVEEMEKKLESQLDDSNKREIQTELRRLNQCLVTLDESLGNAYRPDFEVPCNDIRIAFMALFDAYVNRFSI